MTSSILITLPRSHLQMPLTSDLGDKVFHRFRYKAQCLGNGSRSTLINHQCAHIPLPTSAPAKEDQRLKRLVIKLERSC